MERLIANSRTEQLEAWKHLIEDAMNEGREIVGACDVLDAINDMLEDEQ